MFFNVSDDWTPKWQHFCVDPVARRAPERPPGPIFGPKICYLYVFEKQSTNGAPRHLGTPCMQKIWYILHLRNYCFWVFVQCSRKRYDTKYFRNKDVGIAPPPPLSNINVGSNLTRNCLVSIYLNFANFGQIIKAMVAFHRRCIIWILWVLYPHHIQLKVMKFQKFSAAGKLQYFHFPPSGRPPAPGARHLYKWRHTPLVKKSLPLLIWKRQSPLFMAQHNKRSQMKQQRFWKAAKQNLQRNIQASAKFPPINYLLSSTMLSFPQIIADTAGGIYVQYMDQPLGSNLNLSDSIMRSSEPILFTLRWADKGLFTY